MNLAIRTFREEDIGFALVQTQREGWDSTAESFKVCLAYSPAGCFIGEVEGQRVGMVTTTRYERTGWIGNLIVPPEHRSQGIGRRLMTHAMDHLDRQGIATIRLEADPPGVKMYISLGFVSEFESLRFRLEGFKATVRSEAARLSAADLSAVGAFDAECFGDNRSRWLQLLFEQATGAYWLGDRGRIQGYAMLANSLSGIRIGPWVAVNVEAADALLRSILAEWRDTAIVLGLPSINQEATTLLTLYGFSPTPSCHRMIYGEKTAGGRPERIFAIANGATG